MLQLVPNSLREAAVALGRPNDDDSARDVKAARAGVVTACCSLWRVIAGETAPLLFYALSNQFFTADLSDPMANLPVTIFKFALSPFCQLAADGMGWRVLE
jgi:phosphate transport system permease protein